VARSKVTAAFSRSACERTRGGYAEIDANYPEWTSGRRVSD
jgi:hypothetical protein